MECSTCNNLVHVKCIPFLTKKDSVYLERESNKWICSKCIEELLPFNHLYEEDDFITALWDYWYTESPIPFDLIQNTDRVFQPFELNADSNSPLLDIDPDVQFFHNQNKNNFQSCEYHLEESFNKKLTNLRKPRGDINERKKIKNNLVATRFKVVVTRFKSS